jgi:hypothetical protein
MTASRPMPLGRRLALLALRVAGPLLILSFFIVPMVGPRWFPVLEAHSWLGLVIGLVVVGLYLLTLVGRYALLARR